MSDQSPPSVGQVLGLGPNWQPAPCSWEWHELGTTDGTKIFVFKLNTVGGTTAAAFTSEDLRTLIAQATERMTGLVLPQPSQVPPPVLLGNGHRRPA